MDEMKLPEIEDKKLEKLLKRDIEKCIAQVTEAVNTAPQKSERWSGRSKEMRQMK
jgi:hypothetical protein